MEINFKNTYYVSCLVLNGREIDIDLVEYNTFEDFAEFLKSKRIGFKRIDHDNTYWYISEKDYSSVSDWHHGELEDYMRENLDERWSEDAESCFFAQGLTLEEMFNQLKQIDEVELELICEVEPGDYINKYVGPYQYGEAWGEIKAVCDTPVNNQPKDNAGDYKPKYASDYIDWETIVNRMRK